MRSIALILVLAVAPAFAGEDDRRILLPAGTDLVSNADLEKAADGFAAGFGAYRSEGGMRLEYGPHGIGGSRGVLFAGPATVTSPVKPSGVSCTLTSPKAGETIEITAWLRLDTFAGTCEVWARCDDADGMQSRDGAFSNSTLAGYDLTGNTHWSPVTIRVTPDAETKRVMLGVLAGGSGRVSVHSIHARVRKDAPKPIQANTTATGPGLYRAEGRTIVLSSAKDGSVRVLIPVPNTQTTSFLPRANYLNPIIQNTPADSIKPADDCVRRR